MLDMFEITPTVLSISARLCSALRIISAAVVVFSFFFFPFIPFFFGTDFLVNFNNKITKISRIYAHQKKNRISKNFLIFLSKNGEISPEKKKHDLRGFGLVFSVRWFALGSGQAAAFFSVFFLGAGNV